MHDFKGMYDYWGCSVIELLYSMFEALGSVPSTVTEKEKGEEEMKGNGAKEKGKKKERDGGNSRVVVGEEQRGEKRRQRRSQQKKNEACSHVDFLKFLWPKYFLSCLHS